MISSRGSLDWVADWLTTGRLRVAVTGLSRAGKTIFITSLVQNLIAGSRRPDRIWGLGPVPTARFMAARVEPPVRAERPRFMLGRHVAALTADPPVWPESTTDISEIRVAIRYRPKRFLRRRLARHATLQVDVVDYPGEWLLDLPLLGQSFETWSREALRLAGRSPRAALSQDWRQYMASHSADEPAEEAVLQRASELFRGYLRRCRDPKLGLSLVQPGRFVTPGQLEGTPLLWFCPLDADDAPQPKRGSLHEAMARQFEAYKERAVTPFFRDHFARADRQVVLVDILSALNTGPASFEDTRDALGAILESFRFGQSSLLSWLSGSRVDRLLIAATKADHVTEANHEPMSSLLENALARPLNAAAFGGATTKLMVLSALRCTEQGRQTVDGRNVEVVVGVPVGGAQNLALFPGDVPAQPPERADWGSGFAFPHFQPPRLAAGAVDGLPHIRMDDALEFLIGDRLT